MNLKQLNFSALDTLFPGITWEEIGLGSLFWLKFDSSYKTFVGTPDLENIGYIIVKLRVSDGTDDGILYDYFVVNVEN